MIVFFFKQKTAYEMRISDWSSDVCSSDLPAHRGRGVAPQPHRLGGLPLHLAHEHHVGLGRLSPVDRLRLVAEIIVAVLSEGLAQIGKASGRERVCQYVLISVVAESLKQKKTNL